MDTAAAQGLYISSTDAASGKTVVALGVAEAMSRRVRRLGVFRPVVRGGGTVDEVVELIRTRYRIGEPYEDCVGTTYDAVHLDPARAVETIVDRYRALAARCEAVVVVGSDYTDAASSTEFGFNATVAANLALPVLLVVGGMERTPQDVAAVVRVSRQELSRLHATELAVVVNRVPAGEEQAVRREGAAVSGAAHTTAHTIRPAFEIIRTEPGVCVVSSVFFMLLADRVLVYGDCAVVPDPDAAELADIAVCSARTAQAFGVQPRVAMLSYSSGESGSGEDVEKVREAAKLAHAKDPGLPLEGPIQYDAAADPDVAALKLPGSAVAGRATVFIVPDLNTGNNLYKAVQRSAGAIAVGPVLQGLRKPVNDLSRGALVQDIVNTIVITAVQSQGGASGEAERTEKSEQ